MEYIAGNRYVLPFRSQNFLLRIHSQRLVSCKESTANVLLIAGSPDRRSLRQESYNSSKANDGRHRSLSFGLFDNIDNFHQYLRGGI